MKKLILMFSILFSFSFLFAEEYEVKSVSGKVMYMADKAKLKKITVGQILTDETNITIDVNSKLILTTQNGKDIFLRQQGKASISQMINNRKKIAGITVDAKKGIATHASRAAKSEDTLDED
jgi:plasmid maintenance system antidote protein VapI